HEEPHLTLAWVLGFVSVPVSHRPLAPQPVQPASIIEIKRRLVAAVQNDPRNGLAVGMTENIAVARDEIARTVEQLEQRDGCRVRTTMMRELERVQLQLLAWPPTLALKLLDRFDKHVRMGVAGQKHCALV